MKTIHLLSGGAAHGLVSKLQADFEADHICSLQGSFNSVGVMRDRLLAGDACDVILLTRPLIEQLIQSGQVRPGSERSLGWVKTGIAVKTGQSRPQVDTVQALSAALRQASAIFFPDPQKATAGIHFFNVLKQLGLDAELARKLHDYPNGAAAMLALAECSSAAGLGCTQVTEILNTPGVQLIDVLPKGFELATNYVAAVCTATQHLKEVTILVDMLTNPAFAHQRQVCGFLRDQFA